MATHERHYIWVRKRSYVLVSPGNKQYTVGLMASLCYLFFAAVYFFDLFMDNYQIEYWRLCMVALNSIWLAAKLEESSAPKVSHLNAQLSEQPTLYPLFFFRFNILNMVMINCYRFFYLTVSPYEPKDYTNLERIMVHFFQWNLLVPTAATFLEHYVEELMRNGPDEYFKDGREHMLCTQGAVARLAFEFLDITLSGTFFLPSKFHQQILLMQQIHFS